MLGSEFEEPGKDVEGRPRQSAAFTPSLLNVLSLENCRRGLITQGGRRGRKTARWKRVEREERKA